MQEYQQEQEKREEVKQQIALVATKLLHDPEQHCRELQPLIQLVSSRDEVVSASEIGVALAVLQVCLAIAAYKQLECNDCRHPQFARRAPNVAQSGTCRQRAHSQDRTAQVARLAMLSLAAVFKDILPGYRIRAPTEKELAMPVSKDVKRLRDHESALLRAYQAGCPQPPLQHY